MLYYQSEGLLYQGEEYNLNSPSCGIFYEIVSILKYFNCFMSIKNKNKKFLFFVSCIVSKDKRPIVVTFPFFIR